MKDLLVNEWYFLLTYTVFYNGKIKMEGIKFYIFILGIEFDIYPNKIIIINMNGLTTCY